MNFDEYQAEARKTAVYEVATADGTKLTLLYPALGLAGETGEVCEKIKKLFRDKGGIQTPEFKEALTLELGDVLWYLANLACDAGIKMADVADANIRKLHSRRERNMIKGDGDNR